MKFVITRITQIWVHQFKLLSLLKSTQYEKMRFIKGNKLKLTQEELLSFYFILFFISVLIWFSDSWGLKTCRQSSNIYISKTWPGGRRSFYGKRKIWYKKNITSVLFQHFTRAPSSTLVNWADAISLKRKCCPYIAEFNRSSFRNGALIVNDIIEPDVWKCWI